ncbi:tetratricopeptide repeat protein [bacterium]|nr:tetratricopeptide repeat protein [bacterium]
MEQHCCVHYLTPATGVCVDCGRSYCGQCLDSAGRCDYCARAAERFLDGFALSLNRWEAGLRSSRLDQAPVVRPPLRRRFTLRRVILGLLLGAVVWTGVDFLLNYHLMLGQLLLSRGKLDQALEHLEKAVEKDPADTELSFMLGNLYLEKGYYDDAILAYSQVIAQDSTNAPAYNNLAWTYAELNTNLNQAEALSRRSLELDKDNPEYLDTLAEVYFKRKEYLRALTFIRKAVEQNPPNIEYYKEKLEKIRKMAYGESRLHEI